MHTYNFLFLVNVNFFWDLKYYYILLADHRFKNPPSPLSLFREPSFGHGRLRILNETHAHWSWHRNNDKDAIVADGIWIESLSNLKACSETPNQQVAHQEL